MAYEIAEEMDKGQDPSPSQSMLQSLSPEIVYGIMKELYYASPQAFKALKAVNRICYGIAQRFRLRDISLHYDFDKAPGDSCSKSTQEKIQALLKPEQSILLHNTRHLTITSWWPRPNTNKYYAPGTQEARWATLASLIRVIPSLRTVHFEAFDQVPVVMIEALLKHPQAHLHVRNWTRMHDWQDHTDPAEIALSYCPNLRSIHSSDFGSNCKLRSPLIDPFTYPYANLGQSSFHRILKLAPNLKRVEVECRYNPNSAEGVENTITPHDFASRAKLFEVQRVSDSLITQLKWSGIDYLVSLLEDDAIDLSRVESLDFEQYIDPRNANAQPLFWKVEGRPAALFDNLKHLSIVLYDGELSRAFIDYSKIAATDFVASLHNLESLSLINWTELPDESIKRIFSMQRFNLRCLKLHDQGSIVMWQRKSRMVTAVQLRMIRYACPHLEDLAINIKSSIDGSLEEELLDEVALFPYVKTLRVSVNSGLTQDMLSREYGEFFWLGKPGGQPGPVVTLQELFANNAFNCVHPDFVERFWCVLAERKLHNLTVGLWKLSIMIYTPKLSMGFVRQNVVKTSDGSLAFPTPPYEANRPI